MKRLILMRHAKSDWSHGLADHDRPLNPRGTRASAAMGDWLRNGDMRPDEVLCSTATRTRETLARLALGEVATRFDRRLYHAAPDVMQTVLQEAGGDTVLVLGHNPGIAMLAETLVETPPDHPRFDDYPTCATLVAAFDIDDWAALSPGEGAVLDFRVPREFTD